MGRSTGNSGLSHFYSVFLVQGCRNLKSIYRTIFRIGLMLGKRVYLMHPDDVWVPDELHGRDLSLYLQLQTSRASKSETRPRGQRANLTVPTKKRVTTHASQRTRTRRDREDARAHLPPTAPQRVYWLVVERWCYCWNFIYLSHDFNFILVVIRENLWKKTNFWQSCLAAKERSITERNVNFTFA